MLLTNVYKLYLLINNWESGGNEANGPKRLKKNQRQEKWAEWDREEGNGEGLGANLQKGPNNEMKFHRLCPWYVFFSALLTIYLRFSFSFFPFPTLFSGFI